MKRLISMLLVIGVGLFFFGCQKDIIEPDLNMDDQQTTALKKAKVKRTFEGICTPVEFIPDVINKWHDETDDWRTTGTTLWVQPDPLVFEGTATLLVDPKNPHEVDRGIWDMTWKFMQFPSIADNRLIATAEGIGVAGKVKGMKAYWTYTMDHDGTDETFFYVVEGNIDKPQGPIKKD